MEGVNAIPGKRGFERLQVHRVGGHGQFTENATLQEFHRVTPEEVHHLPGLLNE
jgi:hypothetical protein